jgi:hypothetical protein
MSNLTTLHEDDIADQHDSSRRHSWWSRAVADDPEKFLIEE